MCAVAVHHSYHAQNKTLFVAPYENFKASEFVANLIMLIKSEDRDGVFKELGNLAKQLQQNQNGLDAAEKQRKANQGDAVIFPSDVFHAAAAPLVAYNEKPEDFPRVTSYMQFVPKAVVEEREWRPLLRTLYNAEVVFDRRTMVGPSQLLTMLTQHGENPLVVERARLWLDGLRKGRVNCIQC